jgi:hypothetical protein
MTESNRRDSQPVTRLVVGRIGSCRVGQLSKATGKQVLREWVNRVILSPNWFPIEPG